MVAVFDIPLLSIGIKLLSTPWNDEHLQRNFGSITTAKLRQDQLDHGMPASLVDVLHLAGEVGVRILIFDGDAPQIPSLPLYAYPH